MLRLASSTKYLTRVYLDLLFQNAQDIQKAHYIALTVTALSLAIKVHISTCSSMSFGMLLSASPLNAFSRWQSWSLPVNYNIIWRRRSSRPSGSASNTQPPMIILTAFVKDSLGTSTLKTHWRRSWMWHLHCPFVRVTQPKNCSTALWRPFSGLKISIWLLFKKVFWGDSPILGQGLRN